MGIRKIYDDAGCPENRIIESLVGIFSGHLVYFQLRT